MRGPFQEPVFRPISNRPVLRNTVFGTAAALGGAFIKSLLPNSSLGLRLKPLSRSRIKSYAASQIIRKTPLPSLQVPQTSQSVRPRRPPRRSNKFVQEKVFLRRSSRRKSRPRRRYKPYSRYPNARVKYRTRNRQSQLHRRHYLKRLRPRPRYHFTRYY